jgi:hypothetical protein
VKCLNPRDQTSYLGSPVFGSRPRNVGSAVLRFVVELLNLRRCQQKSRLNSGNACYHSTKNLWSSRLLYKNVKIRIYKTIILPVVLHGTEAWGLDIKPGT